MCIIKAQVAGYFVAVIVTVQSSLRKLLRPAKSNSLFQNFYNIMIALSHEACQ